MVITEEFIRKVEDAHFRTNEDTGAHPNALMIWNIVRAHIGLPALSANDLPAFCDEHKKYHVIKDDYGCRRIRVRQ